MTAVTADWFAGFFAGLVLAIPVGILIDRVIWGVVRTVYAVAGHDRTG